MAQKPIKMGEYDEDMPLLSFEDEDIINPYETQEDGTVRHIGHPELIIGRHPNDPDGEYDPPLLPHTKDFITAKLTSLHNDFLPHIRGNLRILPPLTHTSNNLPPSNAIAYHPREDMNFPRRKSLREILDSPSHGTLEPTHSGVLPGLEINRIILSNILKKYILEGKDARSLIEHHSRDWRNSPKADIYEKQATSPERILTLGSRHLDSEKSLEENVKQLDKKLNATRRHSFILGPEPLKEEGKGLQVIKRALEHLIEKSKKEPIQ